MHKLLCRPPDELATALDLHARTSPPPKVKPTVPKLPEAGPPGGPEVPEPTPDPKGLDTVQTNVPPTQASTLWLWTVAVAVFAILVTGGVWWATSASGTDGPTPNPPSPTATPSPTPAKPQWPLAREGDRYWKARTVQYLLVAHGYEVKVDGIFGPKTASAVKEFQTQHALEADGKVGPKTWPLLVLDVRSQAKGPAVSAVQSLLTNAAYTTDITGLFTAATAQNLSTFQETHQLSVTGVADASTWLALMGAQLEPVRSQLPG
ncbi:peptidoglycan-binding protein [Streptomyces sp. NBC_00280]